MLAQLLDAATSATSREEFRRAALEWVNRYIGIDTFYFGPMDSTSPDHPVISGFSDSFVKLFQESGQRYAPDIGRMVAPAFAKGISRDSESFPELPTTIFYDEILRHLGLQPTGGLSVVLKLAGKPTAMIQMARGNGSSAISEQAFELLRQAVPVLALGDGVHGKLPVTRPTAAELTPRELEVVQYAVLGLSNAEIALACGTSPYTVKNQLAAIFRKLSVGSRAELVRVALSEGLAPR